MVMCWKARWTILTTFSWKVTFLEENSLFIYFENSIQNYSIKSFNSANDLTEKEIESVCFYADYAAGYKKIINWSGAHQMFWYYFLSEIILEQSWNSLMILV